MSMRYRNDRIKTTFEKTSRVIFDPSGYVSVKGSESNYDISIISNDGYAPTEWYQLSVAGKGSEVTLKKVENGYILYSDSLKNTTVSANNDLYSPSRTFSTNCNEAYIYQIDQNTIGIAVDTDKDGTYETELFNAQQIKGDVNGDESITASDAQMALGAYAELIAGNEHGLTDTQFAAADVDGNGNLSARDAQFILMYFLLNNVLDDPTDWETLLAA